MPAEAELVGPGLTLVPVRPGSREALLAGDLVGRTAGPGWPHEDTTHALDFADQGGWTWLIVDDAGRVVGELGTKAPPSNGTVEIGYGLAAPSRGHGLGTRAVARLLDWLTAEPGIDLVTAYVAVGNLPSRRLLERLGFTDAGVVDGEVRYELRCT